jgi:hypothetical protein
VQKLAKGCLGIKELHKEQQVLCLKIFKIVKRVRISQILNNKPKNHHLMQMPLKKLECLMDLQTPAHYLEALSLSLSQLFLEDPQR